MSYSDFKKLVETLQDALHRLQFFEEALLRATAQVYTKYKLMSLDPLTGKVKITISQDALTSLAETGK